MIRTRAVGSARSGRRLWEQSGVGPNDIDVLQVYENTSGGAVAVMVDIGLCTSETAGELFTFENLIAPSGRLPTNTAGGNLAEGFFHGMGLALEGVRQIRGTSVNQVPRCASVARDRRAMGTPGERLPAVGPTGAVNGRRSIGRPERRWRGTRHRRRGEDS